MKEAMEFTGRLSGITCDYATGIYTVLLQVNETGAVLGKYDDFKDLERVSVSVKRYRKKRSLDANAYAWVLMSHMASLLATSKEEVYEEMLRRYGVLYEDEEGYLTITVKADVDMSKIEGHWFLIKEKGNFKAYAMIKGSSRYDTKEMSVFIDGIVSEAKELGIETLTPRELEEMKVRWKP